MAVSTDDTQSMPADHDGYRDRDEQEAVRRCHLAARMLADRMAREATASDLFGEKVEMPWRHGISEAASTSLPPDSPTALQDGCNLVEFAINAYVVTGIVRIKLGYLPFMEDDFFRSVVGTVVPEAQQLTQALVHGQVGETDVPDQVRDEVKRKYAFATHVTTVVTRCLKADDVEEIGRSLTYSDVAAFIRVLIRRARDKLLRKASSDSCRSLPHRPL